MEIIENLKNTLYKRVKSSFGGTLILVWSIYNWELIYSLFNFDKELNLESKITFIKGYISEHKFYGLFFLPVIYSISSIIIFTSFSYLAYWISSLFHYRLSPFILKKVDNRQIVNKERFDFLEKQYFSLLAEHNTKQEEFRESFDKVENLQQENLKLSIDNAEISTSFDDQKNEFLDKSRLLQKELKEEKSKFGDLKLQFDKNIKEGIPNELFEYGDWEMKVGHDNTGYNSIKFRVKNEELITETGQVFKILNTTSYGTNFLTFDLQNTNDRTSKKYFLSHKGDSHYIGFDNESNVIIFSNGPRIIVL